MDRRSGVDRRQHADRRHGTDRRGDTPSGHGVRGRLASLGVSFHYHFRDFGDRRAATERRLRADRRMGEPLSSPVLTPDEIRVLLRRDEDPSDLS